MLPFSLPTRTWFAANFAAPTPVQAGGWAVLAAGRHALLAAPTGSGKTLAAFLVAIDRVSGLPADAPAGVRVLYISPLKALVYDVERNLRAPLAGIRRSAEHNGLPLRPVGVAVRTGDTPARERQRQAREPAEILVTTPESLFLILGSRARETLATVDTLIVDEIHALAPTKRGAHLALSLERLVELTGREPQRIGLSATVRPLDLVARYLGGTRPVEVVDARAPPRLDLRVVVPVPDMERVPPPVAPPAGGSILGELYAPPAASRPPERGIWSALYPALVEAVRGHRSTIVFVNSRGLCERLCQRLNELAGEELVRAHHGSVSHARRAEMEELLKLGRIRGIVATSSLELGIDMGAVDQVLLVESPGSVARGLQRVGRAGHGVGQISVGRLYPKFRSDLLESAVVAGRMLRGEIEALQVPRNPLDVLAQQVVAACADRPRTVPELATLVRRADAYRELSDALLHAVLDMLSGRYPSAELADLRPWLVWDREADRLTARAGASLAARLNAGTIPDRGGYAVHAGEEGPRVGELDEEMVFETRTGDTILLGASTWRVEAITRDRVIVSPAPGEPGRLPFWRGDGPGRPLELGRALGAFVRRLGALDPLRCEGLLLAETPLDAFAARNLTAYLQEQKTHTGTLPGDRSITVERFRDELGDWRVCLLTPFGARLHAPWAMAIQRRLATRSEAQVQVMYTDDGIVLRFADTEELPELDLLLPDPEAVEGLVTEQLADTALFAGLFRENAARALLLPRRRPGGRSPLWAQRLKAQQLLAAVRRYPGFPILLETYRQALADVFDLPGLVDVLRRIRAREISVHEVETRSASPFARSLVFAYVAAFIYAQDAPLAERKAQALTLDRQLLADLLGQAELRELIDPLVLDELEAALQRRVPERRARDAEQLHDLLRRLGDLSEAELAERCAGDPAAWLAHLADSRRAARLAIAGEHRWVAAEDAALYRDALGCQPPAGLPEAFLAPVERPLEQLLRRYARTRGPFTSAAAATRFGLGAASVEPILSLLEGTGVLVRGEIRPGGANLDWCDTEVLRRLKRATLARLRHQVAPVEARVLGRFLPLWQGLGDDGAGPERLYEVLTQLEGLALPWSVLSGVLLPARVPNLSAQALDLLCATGRVVWVGVAPLGPGDGRVAVYRRENAARLLAALPGPLPDGPIHRALLDHLRARGACFLFELEAAAAAAAGTDREAFRAALWDLVWAGALSNDTFAPLRSLGRKPGTRAGARAAGALAGGRWSLVDRGPAEAVAATERTLARAQILLERYGIVSREVVRVEDLPGGFGPVYRVLKAMEEAGQVRRGYFVEGLSGAQFARPGVVDRLRACKPAEEAAAAEDEPVLVLAALDPANPYGGLLPWPVGIATEPRPRRLAGAWVVLVGGACRLYVGAGGRQLLTFADGVAAATLAPAFRALHRLPRAGRRRPLVIEQVDGVPVDESPHHGLLCQCGFARDYRGLVAVETTPPAAPAPAAPRPA